jgi:hypothetical protein
MRWPDWLRANFAALRPSVCQLEKMRLVGGGGSPTSQFYRPYAISPIFVFYGHGVSIQRNPVNARHCLI